MKSPKSLSAKELIKMLKIYGCEVVSQKGSHIKVTTKTQRRASFSYSKPSIKTGTLNAILRQVSGHIGKSKEEILGDLFSWQLHSKKSV